MSNQRVPAPARWPFYLADVALLATAFWIVNHYPAPLPPWALAGGILCVIVAAFLGVMPHRAHYQAIVQFAESNELTDVVRQINRAEEAAGQIQSATAQWQGVQEHSSKAINAAREIGDRMAAEAKAFVEFMQKANDQEKAALRLEVEKLRRGEGHSVQVLVHLLDHVYALQQAGARSGQPNLEAQLTRFQDACRDVVRRVGLIPQDALQGEDFDGEKHQLPEGQPEPKPGSVIAQTLATGYSFQGQLIRRALVAIRTDEPSAPPSTVEDTDATFTPASESEPAVESPAVPDSSNESETTSPNALQSQQPDQPQPRTAHGDLFQLEP